MAALFNVHLPTSLRGTVTMLNQDGMPFMEPVACKDWVHDALTHFFYPRYGKLWHIENRATTKPNIKNPGFVFYSAPKNADKNAKKFARMLNQIEDMIGVDGRTVTFCTGVGKSDIAMPFVAVAPNFWIKSPVAVSAYLTFLRLSPYMRLGESFDDFIKRQLSPNSTHLDARYIRIADKSGNISGLLNRSLPCLNREEYSDYLLSCHSRGLAVYNADADKEYPMDEESLIAMRIQGRRSEMERLAKYPFRRNA